MRIAMPMGVGVCLILLLICNHSLAEEAVWSLPALLEKVPPLKHDPGGRLPMITWTPFVMGPNDDSFAKGKPLPADMYRKLARRGLTQRVPLGRSYIPMALAIQNAGADVIIMDAQGGDYPYSRLDDYRHKIIPQSGLAQRQREHIYPCPMVLGGWEIVAQQIRDTLGLFQQAGIKVRAVWLDWETEPKGGATRWLQAKNCSRCQRSIPAEILNNQQAYELSIGLLRWDVFRNFVARPILQVYPDCSTSNWLVVFSSVDIPTKAHWGHRNVTTPRNLGGFTASNPVAYAGEPVYRHLWKKKWAWPLDSEHMDRVYTYAMLSGISQDAANQRRLASNAQTIPWIARYCPEGSDQRIPLLSRVRYREILRHLWLRGADSMQIFNYMKTHNRTTPMEEVEDAVAVYDEMLAYRHLLDNGMVMNTAVPSIRGDEPIWSGLQLDSEAVVRTFTHAKQPITFTIRPWDDGPTASLTATHEGTTYRLRREGGSIHTSRELKNEVITQ